MHVDETFLSSTVEADGASDRLPSRRWLDLLAQSGSDMEPWGRVCERIEELYASLTRHAETDGDPQFQMFWANLEVLRPSVYSRPPVPVVAERFNDRRQIVRKVAEVIERALVTVTAESGMHDVLRLVRDDLALYGRGVPWVRLHDGAVEVEHIDRCDFRHDMARKWSECRWVAKRAYLDEAEVKALSPNLDEADLEKLGFRAAPGAEPLKGEVQAEVWEVWHRAENKVVHVADGFDRVLKEGKPPVELAGFFPCPRPAYGTLTPRKLIPVPDMVYYRDQLDEINRITARIAALTEMVKLKGFYDSSAGDVRQAIETAFFNTADNALIQGVPGLGKLLQGSGGQLIEWFPVEQASNTIAALVSIRRQLIEDVYQITGLSDIMRGSTNPNETLGAQQLKSQYGSIRIRERQEEMVRIARDIYRIAAEMLAEKVGTAKLLEMGQVTDLPKRADIQKQVKALKDQAMQAAQAAMQQADPNDPEAMQALQQQVEQGAQEAQQQIAGLEGQITVEDVTAFMRDERLRPYALDVETDSTIQPDEDAEKQRRIEFLGAITNAMGPLMQLVQVQPEAGEFAAAVLRFTANGFRAGRELQQPIDDFAEKIAAQANQPRGPDPAQQAAEAEAQVKQGELALKQQGAQREDMVAQADVALKQAQTAKVQAEAQKLGFEAQLAGEAQADAQFAAAMAQEGYAPPMSAIMGAA